MANSKSLVIQSGVVKQIPDADTLLTGAGADAATASTWSLGGTNATTINYGSTVAVNLFNNEINWPPTNLVNQLRRIRPLAPAAGTAFVGDRLFINAAAGAASDGAAAAGTGGQQDQQGGQGGSGSGSIAGGIGGQSQGRGGTGGTGTASASPGAGGRVLSMGGAAGAIVSGFGGANGGDNIIRGGVATGTGIAGIVEIGAAGTSAINIGAIGILTNFLSDIAFPVIGNHIYNVAGTGATVGLIGDELRFTGAKGFDSNGTDASTAGGKGRVAGGGGGAASGSLAASLGGAATCNGGRGGAGGSGSGAAATGGSSSVNGGIGGAGTATVAPANGGFINIFGGNAGAIGGFGGGANGGDVAIRGGIASGTGTNGPVAIGDASTSAINIGAVGITTTFTGTVVFATPPASANEFDITGQTTAAMSTGLFGYISGVSTHTPTDNAAMSTSRLSGAFNGTAGSMQTTGKALAVSFTTAGGSPSNGAAVYIAAAADDGATGAGKLTATAPSASGSVVAEAGIVLDNSSYAGSKTCVVLIQPKSPIQL